MKKETKIVLLRKSIYLTLYYLDKLLNRSNKLVIFCYHSVGNDRWSFSVKPKDLSKQMEYMLASYEPWRLSDVENYLNGKKILTKNAFVVTFDDGYKNLLKTIDIFKKRSIHPTVFLLSDKGKIKRKEIATKRSILKDNDILVLKDAGWEIGSHSKTHPDFAKIDDCDLNDEIQGSKLALEKNLNLKVNYFAYPKGRYSKKIIDCVKKSNYKLALSVDDKLINKNSQKFALPRVGIDGTHSLSEFKASFSPSVVLFRNFIKQKTKKYI